MPRRRYLVAYDIANPKRLRKICLTMESYGERLQYSVFLCDLSPAEWVRLEAATLEIMNLAEDSIISIDLGPTATSTKIRTIGRARRLPHAGPAII
jgi:CRISPR-associated protein Cas2